MSQQIAHKETYEELTPAQQEIIDIAAENPDLNNREIAEKAEEISDASNYPNMVLKEFKHILENRREAVKENSKTEDDPLDSLLKEAEEPGSDRDSGRVRVERGNAAFEGRPLDHRWQNFEERPVKDDAEWVCSCGEVFTTRFEWEDHHETCEGITTDITDSEPTTVSVELTLEDIKTILLDSDTDVWTKENIIEELVG